MPVELMDAIHRANAASASPDRLVAQEDAALVAGAKTGDASAFELLVQRHQGKIFSLAQRMTRNREDAEDVVQQSFQKTFTHLKKLEGKSLFSTWLTRVAMNEARGRSRNQIWKTKLGRGWISRTRARTLRIVACSESRSGFSPRR